MAAPKTTIWPAEPHTLAKHAILRGYLEAWFPILARYQGKIVYYDGFAGPGRYLHGEEGSPLIALDVALRHRKKLTSELVFTFVEEDAERARWLQETELPNLVLPSNFKVNVRNERFEDALRHTLDSLDATGRQIAPTFALVDPFGMTGLPFQLIGRLLQRPSCEVLVTFVTRDINRFVSELPKQVADLIGNPSAPEIIRGSPNGAFAARRLYETSLRSVAFPTARTLTKRSCSRRIRERTSPRACGSTSAEKPLMQPRYCTGQLRVCISSLGERWPHIWLGASVETQKYVHRARIVASLPSAVRFLSCEPLLGPLDLRDVLGRTAVNWVIAGGESGRGARAMDPAWALAIRDQCGDANVAFFFKQWGGVNKKRTGRLLENRTWDQLPNRPTDNIEHDVESALSFKTHLAT